MTAPDLDERIRRLLKGLTGLRTSELRTLGAALRAEARVRSRAAEREPFSGAMLAAIEARELTGLLLEGLAEVHEALAQHGGTIPRPPPGDPDEECAHCGHDRASHKPGGGRCDLIVRPDRGGYWLCGCPGFAGAIGRG